MSTVKECDYRSVALVSIRLFAMVRMCGTVLVQCSSRLLVWFPDPSVMCMRGRGKKGLGNNCTLARAMNKKSWNVKKC